MSDAIDRSMYFKVSSMVIGAFGIAASVTVYFYENYKIPLKELEIKIEQKNMVTENSSLKEKLDLALQKENEITRSLKEASDHSLSQEKTISELQKSYLFYPNSYYPTGLGSVRIGDDISLLKKYFKDDQIKWLDTENDDLTATATNTNSYFYTASYDYNRTTKKIVSITFNTKSYGTQDDEFLFKKLSDVAGAPVKSRGDEIYRWRFADGVDTYLFSRGTYEIMLNTYAPLIWRDPLKDLRPKS
jgi:hypothetical protein